MKQSIKDVYIAYKAAINLAVFIFIVAALLPLALLLAGSAILLVYKYNPAKYDISVILWAWPDYLSAWYDGHLSGHGERIGLVGGLSFAVIYLLLPMIIAAGFRERRELHGSSRWATYAEIQKAGLFSESGIVVGKYNGRILRFPGQQFVMLAAPTRSGKGVGVVIPNLLTHEDSVCVLDIKQENFEKTAGYRKKVLKQEVYLFNPFAEDEIDDKPAPRTHRYNFFSSVRKGVFRVGDISSIGIAIWSPGNPELEFWNSNARNLFLAVSLFLCELRDKREEEGSGSSLPDYPVTIGEVLRQTSGRDTGLHIKKYFETKILTYDWLSAPCRGAFSNFLSSSDDVLSSILSTFNSPLLPWRNPIVDAATSACDFDVRDVRKKRMSIYVGITPDKLDDAKLIINLLFSQLINLNTKELPEKNPQLKYQCLLLMDEFTSIGVVNIIAKAVSYIAGYNLRLLPIIQSTAQLESSKNYGRDEARNLITNHAMQIVYAPREQKDANDVSESLGYFTEKSTSVSRPKGFSAKGGGSESTSDQRRALLLPQEVKEIGQWKEIILLENVKPIFCDKIRYFDDPEFKSRVLPPPYIEPIDIEKFIAKSNGKTRVLEDNEIDFDDYALKPPSTPEYLDIFDKTDLPPPEDPLDEDLVNDYVLQGLEAMGVPMSALSKIDLNALDMLDATAPIDSDGTDEATAITQVEDAFDAFNEIEEPMEMRP